MDMEEKVRREIKILRLFMHPHIVRLYEVIESSNDMYVITEYVKNGELFDYIVEKGRLLEDDARRFFQQIVSGVEYCHRNMVVHRDLKPENILLDAKMHVKIADFGLSNVMRDGRFLKTSCGSPNYAAPEVISGKLYAGPEVDVWSCGVILYALLCGSLPFDDENIPNLFKKIKGGIFHIPTHLSPGARDIIPRMLLVDPLKRITIAEIRQHPWYTLHLPRYLAVMQAGTTVTSTAVDEDILQQCCKLGFQRDIVVDSIRNRNQNKASVAYYLIADNRRRIASSGYLTQEMTEASTSMMNPLGVMQQPNSTESQKRVIAQRKWRLGVQSRQHPSTLMAELYRAFHTLGIAWKKIAPYCIRGRFVYQSPATSTSMDETPGELEDAGQPAHQDVGSSPRLIKMEVQLYKSRDGDCLMDIQRLHGDLFLFIDLSWRLLGQLRITS
uniref:non-specific serine/threonine protein kinase n=1 Tax=Tetraselmis chuii TaxID=63592 RepID=A0A7S1T1J8_9CHLO